MCDNYEDEKRCKDLFKENVLFNHNTLPIGEFAIGTNTTAYVSANRYDIVYLLPILIVEKMGPHFALGDTCYSRSEDVAVFSTSLLIIPAPSNSLSSAPAPRPIPPRWWQYSAAPHQYPPVLLPQRYPHTVGYSG